MKQRNRYILSLALSLVAILFLIAERNPRHLSLCNQTRNPLW